jgi:acetylglutamate kinase
MRFTDEQTMDVVEMVLGGKVNKAIVAGINQQGGKAVGLSGKDGNLISAKKIHIKYQENADKPPEIIDPGLVGQVTNINPDIINTLIKQDFIPIVAPVGIGESGETFNINADHVADKIAISMSAERLIYLTDVDGVLDSSGSVISSINTEKINRMIDDKTVSEGMIPKLECALDALENRVKKVHIINGCKRHSVLLELFTHKGIGTEVIIYECKYEKRYYK